MCWTRTASNGMRLRLIKQVGNFRTCRFWYEWPGKVIQDHDSSLKSWNWLDLFMDVFRGRYTGSKPEINVLLSIRPYIELSQLITDASGKAEKWLRLRANRDAVGLFASRPTWGYDKPVSLQIWRRRNPEMVYTFDHRLAFLNVYFYETGRETRDVITGNMLVCWLLFGCFNI